MDRPDVGRAFVALRPPADVLAAVDEAVAAGRAVSPGLRWAPEEQWHLTLRFLGPVAGLAAVVEALRTAVGHKEAFSFRLGGAGAFPVPKRARVVWIGAVEGRGAVVDLAGAVSAALGSVGYGAEARGFRPHLTLARLKVPADVGPVLAAIGPDPVGEGFPVGEVVLYESRLSPNGPKYTVLEHFPLGNP